MSARYKKPIDKNDRVEVWQFEEKQSDVNLALHMYRDSLSNAVQQQVLVTSDSDLVPALEFIKQDAPQINLGLILPRSNRSTSKHSRPANESLNIHTNWTRGHILDEECQNAQLPEKIPTRKKPILKPKYW